MARREAFLEGAQSAARLHEQLGVRAEVEARAGSIDVFGAIIALGTPLIFRPLEGLLGACIPGPGVIISTERPLPIQRFTGAHELGHIALGHTFSLDGEEILTRLGHNGGQARTPDIEVTADSFASAFLLSEVASADAHASAGLEPRQHERPARRLPALAPSRGELPRDVHRAGAPRKPRRATCCPPRRRGRSRPSCWTGSPSRTSTPTFGY